MERIVINALVYQSQGFWIAQCLEFDIVSFTEKLEELPEELLGQLLDQIEADREGGIEPFSGFQPAPQRFWGMFEAAKAKRISQQQGMADRLEIEAQLFAVAA